MVEDEDEDINTDPALLTQHIAKEQQVLVMLQKGPPGLPPQTNGGSRGGYQGRDRQGGSQLGSGGWSGGRGGRRGGGTGSGSFQSPNASRTCNVCCKWHTGEQPEDSCYKRDVAAEHIKLDALEEKQKGANERAKERQEQANHKSSVSFMTSLQNKQDDTYTY
eukprot:3454393-Rhodomonas_salina.1